jgi:hypothetical protein
MRKDTKDDYGKRYKNPQHWEYPNEGMHFKCCGFWYGSKREVFL